MLPSYSIITIKGDELTSFCTTDVSKCLCSSKVLRSRRIAVILRGSGLCAVLTRDGSHSTESKTPRGLATTLTIGSRGVPTGLGILESPALTRAGEPSKLVRTPRLGEGLLQDRTTG